MFRNWLRSNVQPAANRSARRRRKSIESKLAVARPEVTHLEDRTAPATFTVNGGDLNLDLDEAGSSVSIVSNGADYTFTLTGDTWNGTDDAGKVTGDGNAVLTVTADVFDKISLTDSAAGTKAMFANSASNAYLDEFDVALTGDGSAGVTFSGASSFGTNALTVTTDKSVFVGAGAAVSSSTGAISLTAQGTVAGTYQGVEVQGTVSSTNGTVTLTGTGGSGGNHGVWVNGGTVSGGTGAGVTTTLTGTGGTAAAGNNIGVLVFGATGLVTSAGGGVLVDGTGGGTAGGGGTFNIGVQVSNDGKVTAGGTGSVTVQGVGGSTTGGNSYGVFVVNTGLISSAQGDVTVTGTGGGSGASNQERGVNITRGGRVTAGSTGAVNVTGIGGVGTGGSNFGVFTDREGQGPTGVTSGGGSVSVTGTGGGAATGGSNIGVFVLGGATLTAGGTGTVDVLATGGTGSDGNNEGLLVQGGGGSAVTSTNAAVSVVGVAGAGTSTGIRLATTGTVSSGNNKDVTLTVDTADLAGGTVSAGTGNVFVLTLSAGTIIDLGGADTATKLGLTDAELNAITAGKLQIGSVANTGGIVVTAAVGTANTNTTALITGGAVTKIAAGQFTETNLSVTGKTGIGTAGSPFTFAVTNLSTNSSGANADQFLSNVGGAATIDAGGLTAGTGTITLTGGTFELGGSNRIADASKLMVGGGGVVFDLGANDETVDTFTLAAGLVISGAGTLTSTNTIQTKSGTSAAILAGANGLTQSTIGTTTLTRPNTYTGVTNVTAGTLAVTANGALGGTADGTSVATGATLKLSGVSYTDAEPLTLDGGTLVETGGSSFAGDITLAANSNVTAAAELTLSGTISGDFTLNANGPGTLVLTGAGSTFDVLDISNGTVRLGANGTLPSDVDVTVGSGATLALNGKTQMIDALSGTGTVSSSAAAALTVAMTGGGGTFNGKLTGAIGLTVAAAGSQVLGGATNDYTGTTTVNGTLAVTANNALGATGGGNATTVSATGTLDFRNVNYAATEDVTVTGGTIAASTGTSSFAGPITLSGSAATFDVASGAQLTAAGKLTGTQGLVKQGAGTLVLSNTGNDYAGTTMINTGSLRLGAAGVLPDGTAVTLANTAGAKLDLDGNNETVASVAGGGADGGNVTLGSGTLTVGGNSTDTYAGVLSGSGGFTRAGTGTTVLTGTNTYTGTTTISGGTLRLGANNVLSDNTAVVLANAAGATFDLNGNSDTVASLAGGGAAGGNVTLGSGTLSVGGSSTNTYAGVLSGSGGNFTRSGTGTTVLTGTNTYTGTTTISGGLLRIGDGGGTGTLGTGDVMNNAALVFNRDNAYTVANAISGTGSVSQIGTGTTTLTAANTYTGATSVTAGRLDVNGSITSDVTVTGGTFGGTGTVASSKDVTLLAGGTLAPGNSPGTLNVGDTSFGAASTFAVEINGLVPGDDYDQLNVTGTVSIDAGALLNVLLGFMPAIGSEFVLIANDGSDPVTGTFSFDTGSGIIPLPEGKVFTVGSKLLRISYAGGTGNDVTLSVFDPDNPNFTGTAGADSFTVVRNGLSIEVLQEGNLVFTGAPTTLTFSGGAGSDTLTLDYSSGSPIPAGGITFDGGNGVGSDAIVITKGTGAGTVGTVDYQFTNDNDGSISIDGRTVTYTGLEPIDDNLDATDRSFTFNGGTETITVTDDAAAGMSTIDSTAGESVTFANPTNSLTIDAGDGDDTIVITSIDAAFTASLTVVGGIGTDTLDLNASITFASGKSLTIALESLSVGAGAELVAGGTGTIALTADDVALDATSKLQAPLVTLVPQTAGRMVDLGTNTAGKLSLTSAELGRVFGTNFRLGDAATGAVTVSADVTLPNVTNLRLTTSGGVTATVGGITVSGLAITAGGPINFAAAGTTDVDTLAANNTTGSITFVNDAALTVGTVDGVSGVTAANGSILLEALGGTFTNQAAVNSTVSFVTVGAVNFDLQAGSSITASASGLGVSLLANGVAVSYGTGGTFTQAELDTITSPILRINATGHTFNSDITLDDAKVPTLELSGGGITATAGGLVVTNLRINTGGAATFTDTTTDVDVLAVASVGGTLTFTDADGFSVGTVFGTNGIAAAGKTVNLVTIAGTVTQTQPISAATLNLGGTGNAGNYTLTNAGNAVATLSAKTSGSVSYRDTDGLDLAASTVGGTLSVQTGGPLTDSGAVVVTGLTTLTAGAANDITLDSAANDFGTVNIVSGNNVTLVDVNDLILGANSISGNLNLTAGGTLDFSTTTTLAADKNLTADAQTITLSTASSDVSLSGTGTATLTAIRNVLVAAGASLTSAAGDISVTGQGAVAGNFIGVLVGGSVSSTGGNVTVMGTGGNALNGNVGVFVTVGTVSAGGTGKTTTVMGIGGAGVASHGVLVANGGSVTASGAVGVTGTAGSTGNDGVRVTGAGSTIGSANGIISVTGTPAVGGVGIRTESGGSIASGNNKAVTLTADSVTNDGSVSAGTGTVTIQPLTNTVGVDLGGADAIGFLGLTDTELDAITAGLLVVGKIGLAGNIKVSAAGVGPDNATAFSLKTDGTVSQAGAGSFTVSNLAVEATAGVSLKTNSNAIGTIAGSTDGVFNVSNGTNLLTVGTVAGVTGITAAGITLIADDLNLLQQVNAGTGLVTLTPFTAARVINVGTNTAGTLGLTDAELDQITAGELFLGDGTNTGDVTVTAAVSLANAQVPTLFVQTGGAITNPAGGSVAVTKLGLKAATGIGTAALPLTTSVGTLAATTATGGIFVAEANSVTVGTVGAFSGLKATTSGNIAVALAGTDAVLTVAEPISTADGSIALTADDMAITAAVTATTSVSLTATTAARMIDLGTDTAGRLGLTDAELDLVTAPTQLNIGTAANTGGIDVTDAITPMNATVLNLVTGGAVTNAAGGKLIETNIAVTAGTGIGTIADPLQTQATTLAARIDSTAVEANIVITNTGGATVGTVAGVVGVQRLGGGSGNVVLLANSPLTIDDPVVDAVGGDITLTAGAADSNDPADVLTLNANVTATGGNGSITLNGNTLVANTTTVSTVGTGAVTANFNGTGGSATFNTGSSVTSVDGTQTVTTKTISLTGDASLTATGSGAITLTADKSVSVAAGTMVKTNTGTLTITAAGNGGGNFAGVTVAGTVQSTAGDVSVSGTGGDTGVGNTGVDVSGTVAGGGTGTTTTVTGQGGSGGLAATDTFQIGVLLVGAAATITSAGGNVSVTGTGGTTAGNANHGVSVVVGSVVTAGGTGTVTLVGTGGGGVNFNLGVLVSTNAAKVTSAGGAVSVTGTGGGTGVNDRGVSVEGTGVISAGGTAGVTVTGTAGGTASDGVLVQTSTISAAGGTVSVTGTPTMGGVGIRLTDGDVTTVNQTITLTADSIEIDAASAVTAGTSTVTIQTLTAGVTVDLGGADGVNVLGLTDAELDKVTAATINIGKATTGAVTVSAPIIRAAATDLTVTGTGIVFTGGSLQSAGGNVVLNAGTGQVLSGTEARDVITGGGTLAVTAAAGIGAMGNPFAFTGSTTGPALATNTLAGNGNQFLDGGNDKRILLFAAGLVAGTGTVTLNPGTFVTTPAAGIPGPVTLAGGTLAGDGTTGAVTATSGAAGDVVSPGDGTADNIAVLNTGAVTLTADSKLVIDINNPLMGPLSGDPDPGVNFDRLAANGAVALNGALLDVQVGAPLVIGRSYAILTTGGNALTGTFNQFGTNDPLPEGKLFFVQDMMANTYLVQISYMGNQVTLTVQDIDNPTVADGTPGDDVFVISRNAGNGQMDVFRNGVLIFTGVPSGTFTIDALAGNDTLIVDYTGGNGLLANINYIGGLGDDLFRVIDGGAADVVGTLTLDQGMMGQNSGIFAAGGKAVSFTSLGNGAAGVGAIDIEGLADVTVTFTAGGVSAQLDAGTTNGTVFGGMTPEPAVLLAPVGPTAFANVALRNNTLVTVSTIGQAGDDILTVIDSGAAAAHGNASFDFQLRTAAGETDAVNFTGVFAVSDDLTANAKTITVATGKSVTAGDDLSLNNIGYTGTNPLSFAGTLTADDTLTLEATGDLTLSSGATVQSTAGAVTLKAGGNLTAGAAALISAGTTVSLLIDTDDVGGGTANLVGTLDIVAPGGASLAGNNQADTFLVGKYTAALSIDGKNPTMAPGDTLKIDAQNANPFTQTNQNQFNLGGGTVTFTNIETVQVLNTTTVTVDTSAVASDDTLVLEQDAAGKNTYVLTVDGVTGTRVLLPTGLTQFNFLSGDKLADTDKLIARLKGGEVLSYNVAFSTSNGANSNGALGVLGSGIVGGMGAGQTAAVKLTPVMGDIGKGVVTLNGGKAISFSGLKPVDIGGMVTATLTFNGDDDVIAVSDPTLANNVDFTQGGTTKAIRVSGTTGGLTFETVALFQNTNVVIDTTTVPGTDAVTVNKTHLGSEHLNKNLTITTTPAAGSQVSVVGAADFTGSFTATTGAASVQAPLTAGQNVTVTAANTITSTAAITATAGAISLTGTNGVTVADLTAGTDVTLKATAGNITATAGSTTAGGSVSYTAGGTITSASASAGQDLTFKAGAGITSTTATATNGTLTFTATAGDITSTNATADNGMVAFTTSTGAITSTNATAKGAVTMTAQNNIDSVAITTTTGSVTLTSTKGSVSVTGATSSGSNVTLDAGDDVSVSGPVTAAGNIILIAGDDITTSGGGTLMAGGTLTGTAADNVSIGANATAVGAVMLTATNGMLDNTATVKSTGASVTLVGMTGVTSNNVKAATAVSLTSSDGAVTVSGTTQAGTTLVLDAGTDVLVNGPVQSGGNMTLTASDDIITTATLTSGGKLTGTAADDLSIGANATAALGVTLTATSGMLVNTATISSTTAFVTLAGKGGVTSKNVTAQTDAKLTSGNGAVTATTGTTQAVTGDVILTAATAIDSANAVAGRDVKFTAGTNIDSGNAQAGRNVTFQATAGTITLTGTTKAAQDAALKAGTDVLVNGPLTATAGDIAITAGDDIITTAKVTAGGAITGTAADMVMIGANLTGGGAVTLTATNGTLTNNATVTSTASTVTLNGKAGVTSKNVTAELTATLKSSAGAVTALTGTTQSKTRDVVLQAFTDIDSANAVAGKNIAFTATTGSIESNVATAQGGGLTFTARTDIDSTTASAQTALSMSSAIGDITSKDATAGGSVRLMAAVGDVTVTGTTTAGSSGELNAGKTVTVDGPLTAGTSVLLMAGTDVLVNAAVTAGTSLTMTAGDDIVTTAKLTAGTTLTGTAKNDVTIGALVKGGGAVMLTATNGTLANDATVQSTGASVTLTGKAGVTSNVVNAKTTATLTSGNGAVIATTTTAGTGNVVLDAKTGVTSTTATAGQDVRFTAGTNVKSTTATGGRNVTFTATAGAIDSTTATATNGTVTFTAQTNVNSVTATGKTGVIMLAKAGDVTSKTITSSAGPVRLTATAGNVTVTGQTKGNTTVSFSAGTNVQVNGPVEATTGDITLTAGKNLTTNATLTAGAMVIGTAGRAVAINANVTAGTGVSLSNGPDTKTNADQPLTVASGKTIFTAGGDITLSAADDLTLTGATLKAPAGGIVLRADTGGGVDTAGATVNLLGSTFQTAAGRRVDVIGNSGADVFLVNPGYGAAMNIDGAGGIDRIRSTGKDVIVSAVSLTSAGKRTITFANVEALALDGAGVGAGASTVTVRGDDPRPTTTPTADTFELSKTAGFFLIRANGQAIEAPALNLVTFLGGALDDTLTLTYTAAGDPFPAGGVTFEGGTGSNDVRVVGRNSPTATVVGDKGQPNAGVLTTGEGKLTFFDTRGLDLTRFAQVTVAPAGAADLLSVADGSAFLSGAAALRVTGTTGGNPLTQVAVWNVGKLTLDTTRSDGTDKVTVNSGTGAHGIGDFVVRTGAGADQVRFAGSASFGKSVTVTTNTIRIDSGKALTAGTTIGLTAAGNLTGTGATLTAGGPITAKFGQANGGSTVDLRFATINAPRTSVIGGTGADLFRVTGFTSPVSLDGRDPTTAPGDVLEFDAEGRPLTAGANSFNTRGAAVTFTNMETVRVLNSSGGVTVNGTNGADRIEITGPIFTYQLDNRPPVVLVTTPRQFTFNGLGGSDTMIVDLPSLAGTFPRDGIAFDAGTGADDGLRVVGNNDTATLTASAAGPGLAGRVDLNGGRRITYTNFDPTSRVDVSNMRAVTAQFDYQGVNAVVTAGGESVDRKSAPALVVTDGGATPRFAPIGLRNNKQVTLRTNLQAGNDTVTVRSGNNAHRNTNLTIDTGTGTDTVNINGPLTVAGDLTIVGAGAAVAVTGPATAMQDVTVNVGRQITIVGTAMSGMSGNVALTAPTVAVQGGAVVTAGQSVTIVDSQAFQLGAARITAKAGVFSQSGGGATTLTGGVGVVTAGGNISYADRIDGPGGLDLRTAATTLLSSAVGQTTPIQSLLTNAGGTTVINGGLVRTGSGGAVFNDPVEVGTSTRILSAGGPITFRGTVNPGQAPPPQLNLTVGGDTGGPAGTITFGDSVGRGGGGAFDVVTIRPAGNVTLAAGNELAANKLVQTGGRGTTSFGEGSTLTIGAGGVNLSTRSIVFDGAVNSGGRVQLSPSQNVTVSGSGSINAPELVQIRGAGTTRFAVGSTVTAPGRVDLTGTDFRFDGTLTTAGNLRLVANKDVIFSGSSRTTAGNLLQVDGRTTRFDQGSTLTALGGVDLTATDVTFAGSVNAGGSAILLRSNRDVTFTGTSVTTAGRLEQQLGGGSTTFAGGSVVNLSADTPVNRFDPFARDGNGLLIPTGGGALNIVTNFIRTDGIINAVNGPVLFQASAGVLQGGGAIDAKQFFLAGRGVFDLNQPGNVVRNGLNAVPNADDPGSTEKFNPVRAAGLPGGLFVGLTDGRVDFRTSSDLVLTTAPGTGGPALVIQNFEDDGANPPVRDLDGNVVPPDIVLTVGGDFAASTLTADASKAQNPVLAPLFDLTEQGNLQVFVGAGRPRTASTGVVFTTEGRAGSVNLGFRTPNFPAIVEPADIPTPVTEPRRNVAKDSFTVRPLAGAPLNVFGDFPVRSDGRELAPFDQLFPQFDGITNARLQNDSGEGNGRFEFGTNFRTITFRSIEGVGNRQFQAFAVLTSPRLDDPSGNGFAVRLSSQVAAVQSNDSEEASSTILAAPISGGGAVSNPFVVSPNLVNPLAPAGGPALRFADVNGDGVTDLILAAGSNAAPLVTVVDGIAINNSLQLNPDKTPVLDNNGNPLGLDLGALTSDQILAQFLAYEPTFSGGISLAAADLDGDRKAEIIVGAGNSGGQRVRVFQLTGNPLFGQPGQSKLVASDYAGLWGGMGKLSNFFAFGDDRVFRGGVNVSVGDVTGDGTPDLVLGAGVTGAPRVEVYDGRSGELLRNFFAYDDLGLRGGVLVDVGQFDGDDFADIAVAPAGGGAARVRVLNGDRLTQEVRANAPVSIPFPAISPDGTVRAEVTDFDLGAAGGRVRADFFAFDPIPANSLVGGDRAVNGVGSLAFGVSTTGIGGRRELLIGSPRGQAAEVRQVTLDNLNPAAGNIIGDLLNPGGNSRQPITGRLPDPNNPANTIGQSGPIDPTLLRDGVAVAGFATGSPAAVLIIGRDGRVTSAEDEAAGN